MKLASLSARAVSSAIVGGTAGVGDAMTKAPSDRRAFLQLAAGAALGATALPPAVAKALALPANRVTGTIKDVEHVVILMQENRVSDHYFGRRRGVRGYGDPRPLPLPSGEPVWKQPGKAGVG